MRWIFALMLIAGCETPMNRRAAPDVAPATQPSTKLEIDSSQIHAMYHELLPIDLRAVLRIAAARNIDIEAARQRVLASRGRHEATVEAILPVIGPVIAYQNVQGVNQNSNGTLSNVNFNTLAPAVALQWIINPGKVAYDIIASKRRLEASQEQEQSVIIETTRASATQYYDLVLAEAHLQFAQQAVAEADELLRLAKLRAKAGSGIAADELRAQAQLAGRQQELILAFNQFYDRSVKLTVTLHLDPLVTLAAAANEVEQISLVRDDLPIENLLEIAAENRPDLESLRALVRAAKADENGTAWTGIGAQVQAGYSFGGLRSHAQGQTFGMDEQRKGSAGAGLALGAATFGQLKTAAANSKLAQLDVEQKLDQIRAAVITAQQTASANAKLIPIADQQLKAATEVLRVTQTNFRAGTMLSLDVLQSQNAADEARLRYADAVIHYNQSQLDLAAALGVLSEKSFTAHSD